MPDESREEQIERRIDREIAGAVALASHPSGAVTIAPKSMSELLEFSKLMAVSGPCVRAAFRGNPGACLALALQAFKWGADPFAVANKAYITTSKSGETQISYEAQLIHSIVNTRAPLKRRLRATYTGEGIKRSCKITGWLEGEDEPFEYQSPRIDQIAVKNSPLWVADPDQQLFYYSTRAWARRTVPEILLGIYTPEEAQGQIIDVDATEIPERPRREDFAEPPSTLRQAQDSGQEAEPEPEFTPYIVTDEHGEVSEFTAAETAAEACRKAIEEAARQRADLGVAACWENNASLIFDLRERDRDDLADELGRFYAEQLAAADRDAAGGKPAAPSEATPQRGARQGTKSASDATTVAPEETAPAEPPQAPIIEVIKPQRLGRTRSGWDWSGFAEAIIDAARRLPAERIAEFRAVQKPMADALQLSNKELWTRVQQALAAHERGGSAT